MIGFCFRQGANRYALVRIEASPDDPDKQKLVWLSACAECGASFETWSGMVAESLTRRCEKHKRPGKPTFKVLR